ncbi:hypothetical protein EDC04DRAFT_2904762 [Pisolithus marmoratus]|nr:hypothetical protein EDC04DRAFT_2904762 [Pisolithus marmoratus]
MFQLILYGTAASINSNIESVEQDLFGQGTYFNTIGTSLQAQAHPHQSRVDSMSSSYDAYTYGTGLSTDNPSPPTPFQNMGEYSQPQPTLLMPPVLPLPPPVPNPSDPANRLRAAAVLIQVTGKETDVLAAHQNHHGASRAPSQDQAPTHPCWRV